jgi:hypothetical protein
MGLLFAGQGANQGVKDFFDRINQGQELLLQRQQEQRAREELAMQNQIRQAQLEEYQRKAQLNAKYREQLGLMSAPQLGNEQAPVQQTVTGNFSNGLSPLGDPTLLNTPTREVLPSKLDAISTNNPYAKMMVGMLPYVDADTGINSLIKLEEISKKGGITLDDLVKAATEGKLGPQGQALLERAGYGGVFQQKPQDKKYDTEERYDSKSHTTYGRDFYWNEDGTKTYIGNERPIKGRESTNIHIGGKDTEFDKIYNSYVEQYVGEYKQGLHPNKPNPMARWEFKKYLDKKYSGIPDIPIVPSNPTNKIPTWNPKTKKFE